MSMDRFVYNPNADPQSSDAFSGTLEIHVHHARNIHNICIYDNQDVYAKFSLTYNPDETFSTRIINGGGKNPEFNEDLLVTINQADAVLKCEIWMMSRAKSYMDDQLLGFALVPITSVSGKGKVTQDFSLSSTDLFHSPAGTIKLSLSLNAETPLNLPSDSYHDLAVDTSATSKLLLDKSIVPEEYSRLEFPDMNVVAENHLMVSEVFAKNKNLWQPWLGKPDGSFLHLGASPDSVEDCEMAGNSSDEFQADESVSPNGSLHNSSFLSSTMTSLSDDPNSAADSMEQKKGRTYTDFSTSPTDKQSPVIITDTASLKKIPAKSHLEMAEESEKKPSPPIGLARNLKTEAEESAMQQQIVDMYMRSMQQFTESLAKMKLPMDLDKPHAQIHGPDKKVDDNDDDDVENNKKKVKDNSRVFYGSRAFF
ncbi:uncharacterized protein LOC127259179 isoform X2 [Andrographis paniculata]|nr:uncharacterized protein LOC127259179 isoform X2 [Andrographis paniculata]XP_051142294.1 uncharacterized protein LOC127259179 isoform X2 [Andrographis paniculata]